MGTIALVTSRTEREPQAPQRGPLESIGLGWGQEPELLGQDKGPELRSLQVRENNLPFCTELLSVSSAGQPEGVVGKD